MHEEALTLARRVFSYWPKPLFDPGAPERALKLPRQRTPYSSANKGATYGETSLTTFDTALAPPISFSMIPGLFS